MTFSPRDPDEVYQDIVDDLDSSIVGLSNFVNGRFARTFVEAYAEQISEAEYKALASQLAMFVDYAGRSDLTRSDLDELGIDADPARLNPYMRRRQLDELGKLVAVARDTGTKATGQVTFTVSDSSIEIPEGEEVATPPNNDGDYQSFYVDADGDGVIDEASDATVSPDAGTEVTVDVIAAKRGTEGNVGSGTVTYLPTPKPGIQSVTNTSGMSGGADEQGDDSLREDIKSALPESSGGGTARGVEGYVKTSVDMVRDVETIEHKDDSPPNVEVVVVGGGESNVLDAIAESKPLGIRHDLVRPDQVNIGATVQIQSLGPAADAVEQAISDFVDATGLGGVFARSRLLRDLFDADGDVTNVAALTTYVTTVDDETHEFSSGTNIYELEYGPLGVVNDAEYRYVSGTDSYSFRHDTVEGSTVEVEAVVDDEVVTLTGSGTDYSTNGSGSSVTGITLTGNQYPDEGTNLRVTYRHNDPSLTSVTDASGDTYTPGTDVGLIDDDADGAFDSIDFSVGGASPDDGERFEVSYTTGRTFVRDLQATERELLDAELADIEVTEL